MGSLPFFAPVMHFEIVSVKRRLEMDFEDIFETAKLPQ